MDAGSVPRGQALDPSLLTELTNAERHLRTSAAAARAQDTPELAQSIDAVGLEANDLMRWQIRGLRLAAKLTQVELARRVGTRPKAISDFEAGRSTILPDLIQAMSDAIRAFATPTLQSGSPVLRQAHAGELMRPLEVVASGTSMEPSIRHGDKLMVSHDVELAAGRIVVATHGKTWIVKRLASRDGTLVLRSDNAAEEVDLSAVAVKGVVVELRRTV